MPTGLIAPIVQYSLPLAIKGVTLLVGYIAGRIHQHKVESKAPKPTPIALQTPPSSNKP